MIGIGSRVGLLTVAGSTAQRKSKYMVWRCLCDCGGEILLDTRCLQRGTVRDCGCGAAASAEGAGRQHRCNKHPVLKDFVGKRFGKLTVMEYAGKRSGMHRWRCLCDCGRQTVVGQTLLQSGKTKSCGCLQASVYRDNLQLQEGTSVTILRAIKKGRLIKSNTSGHNGVYYNKKRGRWTAQITFQNKTKYLGSFELLEDAVKARQRGEEIYDAFLERLDEAAEKKTDGVSKIE